MGFNKTADGNEDCVVEKVFENAEDVANEMAKHAEVTDTPTVVEMPEEIVVDKETN